MRSLALVGNGITTMDYLKEEFDEVWTTASVSKKLPQGLTGVFEVHKVYDPTYLNNLHTVVYMDGAHPEVAMCEDLMIDELVEQYGAMFQFSFDYMMARALHDGVERIKLFGIDLTEQTEYEHKRQSFFYWVGFARGSGVQVDVSEGSLIFNRKWLYCHGRDDIEEAAAREIALANKRIEEYTGKIAAAERDIEEARVNLAYADGYKEAAEKILRGGV